MHAVGLLVRGWPLEQSGVGGNNDEPTDAGKVGAVEERYLSLRCDTR